MCLTLPRACSTYSPLRAGALRRHSTSSTYTARSTVLFFRVVKNACVNPSSLLRQLLSRSQPQRSCLLVCLPFCLPVRLSVCRHSLALLLDEVDVHLRRAARPNKPLVWSHEIASWLRRLHLLHASMDTRANNQQPTTTIIVYGRLRYLSVSSNFFCAGHDSQLTQL